MAASKETGRRVPAPVDSIIGVIDKKSRTIQTFNQRAARREDAWKKLHKIPKEISVKFRFCVIAVVQDIFVFADDKSSYKFNLARPREGWIELAKRSENGYVQVVEHHGTFFAFHDHDKTSKTIEVLGFHKKPASPWKRIEKPQPCCDEAVTAAHGFIYTFGGFCGSLLQKSVRIEANSTSHPRTSLPDMPTARRAAAATAIGEWIYVLGGRCAQMPTERFDTGTRQWTTLTQMNNEHAYFKAFALHNKVYAVGSMPYDPFVIEEYDSATDTWKDVISVSEDTDMMIPAEATFAIDREVVQYALSQFRP